MNNKVKVQPVLIITAIIAMLGGVWAGFYSEKTQLIPPEIYGTLLPDAKALGRFELIDHNNKAFTENNFQGHWSLVFIGYAHCPDICPATLTSLQQTVEIMQSQNISVPKVTFISIDPARDTPDVLAQYINYFNKDFIGLTGSEAELKNVSKQMAVYYNKVAGASGNVNNNDYLMDHSAALVVINPKAEIQAFLVAPHIPEQIVESMKRSMQYYEDIQ